MTIIKLIIKMFIIVCVLCFFAIFSALYVPKEFNYLFGFICGSINAILFLLLF